jgi:hypothetical protein
MLKLGLFKERFIRLVRSSIGEIAPVAGSITRAPGLRGAHVSRSRLGRFGITAST